MALPLSSLTDRKEGERARGEEEGSGRTEASVGNNDADADASAVWIPVVCLMAVTKEEGGSRRPTVERAANLSTNSCWHEKADNSVNTMKGVLKK